MVMRLMSDAPHQSSRRICIVTRWHYLLEATDRQTRVAPIDRLRERFLASGVALTTYVSGVIRVSLPDHPMSHHDQAVLWSALSRCK